MDSQKTVIVSGGGISGIQASLDLANMGFSVILVEKSGAIGGGMSQLDKVFPTNDCSICVLAPKVVECTRHPQITIKTLTEIVDVQGDEGRFTVKLKQEPRYVQVDKCVGCGLCTVHCPVSVPDEYNGGLAKRTAIYIQYPQAVPLKYQIDADKCLYLKSVRNRYQIDPGTRKKCSACATACPSQAIDFDETSLEYDVQAGAVVMATGFRPYDPTQAKIWAYGSLANVITSIQMERLQAATGPTSGQILRPSDKKKVKKIAFLQCVGSRDKNLANNEYCSSICCIQTIKQASVALEESKDIQISIFHMDIRTHGKHFEQQYLKAQQHPNVRFLRSRVHGIEPEGKKGDLRLHYISDDGRQAEEIYDMVVLSVGLETPLQTVALAQKIGIHTTQDNFASISAFMPVLTSKKGIYSCGCFNGPRDIPRSVIGGSAVAASIARQLGAPGGPSSTQKNLSAPEYPEYLSPPVQDIRIAVFICCCGNNISGVIDVQTLAKQVKEHGQVVHTEIISFACAQDSQDRIEQTIREKNISHLVVAACSPTTHEPLFRQTMIAAGLHESFLEMANLRNLNAWVHHNLTQQATEKAYDMVRMAIAKVTRQVPFSPQRLPVVEAALIVGGGVTGMNAALNIADQGFLVHLVEKTDVLGGNALHLFQTWSGEHIPLYLKKLTSRVLEHDNIYVHFNSTVVASEGPPGNCTSTLRTHTSHNSAGKKKKIQHGTTIIATGGKRYIPTEFGYGKLPNVVASIEFDKLHMHNEVRIANGESFVFIQCVGSRTANRPYCSKFCCTHSIQTAIKLKKEVKQRKIYILYRDMRTYGQRERLYNQARELGIIFINYQLHGPPQVAPCEKDNTLLVSVRDHILHRELQIKADMVILASATLPNPDSASLSTTFNLALDRDGFFQEAHVKLRPVEFHTDGVFVAGLAHAPKPIEESVSQALAAAAKSVQILVAGEILPTELIAHPDPQTCDGCAVCIDVCPYQAISLTSIENKNGAEQKFIAIDTVLCKGCGICQGACPKRGINVTGFSYDQLIAQVDEALAS